MLSLAELETVAPEVAAPIRAKLVETGIGLIATVRRDGSPRISPFEVSIIDGRLFVGSMPGAAKARDLERDGRACLLTPVADKDDLGGEGKLFLDVVRVTDPDEIARVFGAAVEGTDTNPEDFGDSPVFELRITGAAWQRVDGDAWDTLSWTEGDGVRHRRREGPVGEPVDVSAP